MHPSSSRLHTFISAPVMDFVVFLSKIPDMVSGDVRVQMMIEVLCVVLLFCTIAYYYITVLYYTVADCALLHYFLPAIS